MDLLDRLLGHDAWTTGQLLGLCRQLTDEQLDHPFDTGHGTVRATLQHIIFNVEVWSALMAKESVRLDAGSRPEEQSIDGFTARFGVSTARLAPWHNAAAGMNPGLMCSMTSS